MRTTFRHTFPTHVSASYFLCPCLSSFSSSSALLVKLDQDSIVKVSTTGDEYVLHSKWHFSIFTSIHLIFRVSCIIETAYLPIVPNYFLPSSSCRCTYFPVLSWKTNE